MKHMLVMAILIFGTSISVTTPASGAEPTEEMRAFARMSVLVEAHDQKGFCAAMVADPSYVGYVNRACQLAVKNKFKKSEDCSLENTTQEIKADTNRCLAMSDAEFNKSAEAWPKLREEFIKSALAKGIDGEKLLQDAASEYSLKR